MNNDAQQAPMESPEKDRSDWVTGDEPMTGPQRSYLHTLAQEGWRDIPDDQFINRWAARVMPRFVNRQPRGASRSSSPDAHGAMS